ncbi:hypothetical protein AMS68_000127 [Peltaster fructicola]|uniref:Cyclin N-terminal domain-containing protein n=1 Tax=Peltaster fructicola TaxID=286661 RepID=A0A6H0XJA5_9PEZI|nr:hypothetical protein AMS68_000127 [Peltaster fructicola]
MAYHPRDSSSQLPLTPPDSGSGYAYSSMHYPREQYAQRDMAYDYHNYMPPQLAPVAPPYSAAYQPSMYQAAPTTLPSISSYYEPVGAPILPPIRVQDGLPYDDYRMSQYDFSRDSQPVKEEKATGGVSAKLDYDMDRMTDFVVSTTQHIFQQNVSSPPAFRKWVHQVLSATRLPSATILLSLHYLSDRLKVFPDSVPTGENQIYRLLSVGLILGSKFLDDNTFINRSWSDVTAIKVSELNILELKWLRLIEYNLHVDASCVQTWSDLWVKFDKERSVHGVRLSALDTSVARRHDASRTRYSPYPSPYSSSTMSSRTFDNSARSQYTNTPYSAVDPWAPTQRASPFEDYYKRSGSINRYPTLTDIDDANRRSQEQFQSRYPVSHSAYQTLANAPYSAAAAPGYVPWEHYGWNNMHRSDCGCTNCAYRNWRPYGYNMGTVMG